MKRYIENKWGKIFLILIVLFVISFVFKVRENSYALDDIDGYIGDYILNPEWVEYMDLSDDEKSQYNVIPEKFIYQYKKSKAKFKLFGARNSYPEYYNLNDYGWSTFPDNQGRTGLCWAFASLSTVETNMLKNGMSNISNPIKFSVRQIDYASVHPSYVYEGYNPYYVSGRTQPTSGGGISTAFWTMRTGVAPVTNDIYGYFNESTSIKSLNQIFDLDDVQYTVDGYVNYGSTGNYMTDDERNAWVNDIKNHVMNYGSVLVGTIGPLNSYAGSCLYKDKNINNNMLNVNGECNPPNTNNGHAMAIIGWDDNYSYKYCRLENETIDDLEGCSNIVSGKGVFILKNSWGDFYPYPYLTYTSNVYGTYGVTEVSVKNWDTNYDSTKEHDYSYEHKISTITYYKSDEIKEKLEKISFYTNTKKELNYNIYVSGDGSDNYEKIASVVTNQIGLKTIYVDDIVLESDKFSIKVTSSDGYVDMIYAFTSDVDKNNDIVIDTLIKTGYEYGVNVDKFEAYTVTKNVPNGGIVQYKLLDESGNDVTNLIKIYNNLVLNDAVSPVFTINDIFPKGKLTFQTIYKGKVYDSVELNVETVKNLWSGGSGSIDDPFLIASADDFVKIFTGEDYMKAHYKLIDDIDFSDFKDWNIGSISNYLTFEGSFDGDNHIISGLKVNSNLPALFYKLDGAIFKNVIFSDISFDIPESGWANLVAILTYDSVFENIVITKTVDIKGKASYAGGLVGTAYDSKFINIANYANVMTEYAFHGKAAGIVVESYGSEIIESYNYGDIIATESISGGIVGYLGSSSNIENVGVVNNVYNYGEIKSNLSGGGLVGYSNSAIIRNSYNVFSDIDVEDNIGNIAGIIYGSVVKDCYYLNGTGVAVVLDEENKSTLVNVMGKTKEQLKDKNTYLNFDFNDVWVLDESYPYFKDFSYFYLIDIDVVSELEIDLGDTKKIEIKYKPEGDYSEKISYIVDDENIVSVDEFGNVLALKEGSTIIKVNTLDGSGIVKDIKVTVIVDKVSLDDYEIVENKYIKIKENYDVESFIKSIYDGKKYSIKVFSPNKYIGTGDKIEIYDKNNKLVDNYVTFVLGDTTGDGYIDVGDVAKLYQHLRGAFDIKEEFRIASDVFKDSILELNDVAKLYQYIKKGIESLED